MKRRSLSIEGFGEQDAYKDLSREELIQLLLQARRDLGRPFQVIGAEKAYQEALRLYAGRFEHERFFVLLLDSALTVRGIAEGSMLSGSQVAIDPAGVLRQALRTYRVSGLLLVHNHPSGVLRPSPEDNKLTTDFVKAAKMVGLKVLDHLIVSETSWFSFATYGLLPT
jgi:DNA repair protein RadC